VNRWRFRSQNDHVEIIRLLHCPDVTRVAGTKDLRFLHDLHFADEAMDDFNRLMFTFASYNAGPARVRQLRAEAVEMNLDPNVWLGNVEVVAARQIGRETVRYVSNIAKHYGACRLVEAQQELKETAAGA
jgi:membrane-bound lytic murein transglycosylase MltF